MPYDAALAECMRAALQNEINLHEQRMFGGICWMLNGNMLCGVEVGRYMFRVGKEQQAKVLAWPGCEPVVFADRRMGGFVWVNAQACEDQRLARWIALAKGYIQNLPTK